MNNENNVKTAMITGANSGIGLELTKKLISEGWQIVALIRSDFPVEEYELQQRILEQRVRVYKADLANFGELRAAIENIKESEQAIDVLFNNAGGSFDKLYYSAQSREMHFEIQAVVPYIILSELKALLKKGTNKMVVNTSTNVFNFLREITYEELIHPNKFKKLIGPYATSKLALSLWSQEVAAELSADGIKILAVDPGGNNTLRKGRKNGIPFFLQAIMKWFYPHPSKGAGLLYDAGMDKSAYLTGALIRNGKVRSLKFTKFSTRILKEIQVIYQVEYLKQSY
ncbi:NAD(P)-dependent dehydrogenase, short-chain alcohol dehydrogenase family [Amphibacillus marinus]|uniref:NAD(P)-dependent dehydrogenase, short-chain alcohol dehydrogenase family n=1 Tax=Amphibacillus marinus TaxID=872970 RepID=A0A1H8JN58_9BACI|nr:SDR family NAD(P)-dependent oxidoreductase [Amphibacillus marinus]SEN81678.1 NAD(P)-dependent dehydrogenase, short-chain alcohol dehydrogenase family [Amphibacillus marinus]